MREAVEITCGLIKPFEGLYLAPYLCPAMVPTIGYGSTRYPDGKPVTLRDQPISRDAAERMLLQTVRELIPQVRVLCPGIDSDDRLAAITDFAFNLGTGRLRNSTLRRRINEARWDDVPGELRKWVMGGGVRLKGLVRRREAEIALI